MFRFFILAALGAVTLASALPPTGRIIGGHDTEIAKTPYQLSLIYNHHHICGAVLIGDKFALTVATCIKQRPAVSFTVRAGSTNLNEGGVVAQVKQVTVHPQWSIVSVDYDIAILELETALSATSGIAPAKLPAADASVEKGTLATISGWGFKKEASNILSEILQSVQVPTLSNTACKALYPGRYSERMICAGTPIGGVGICEGDSGTPLVVDGTVFGVAAWGVGCARPNYPEVYSSIPKYRSFITEITGL